MIACQVMAAVAVMHAPVRATDMMLKDKDMMPARCHRSHAWRRRNVREVQPVRGEVQSRYDAVKDEQARRAAAVFVRAATRATADDSTMTLRDALGTTRVSGGINRPPRNSAMLARLRASRMPLRRDLRCPIAWTKVLRSGRRHRCAE